MRVGPILMALLAIVTGCEPAPKAPRSDIQRGPLPVEPSGSSTAVAEAHDRLLADARASIVRGEVSESSRRELARSDDGHHRRATRLLQAIALEEPSPIVSLAAPSKPELDPTHPPEPAPEPPPAMGPVEPNPPDVRDDVIDELDPEGFASGSAAAAYFGVGAPSTDLSSRPEFGPVGSLDHPFVGVASPNEPAVLLPLVGGAATPRVFLTRLSIVEWPDLLILEIIGGSTVDVRVQAIASHRLRVRIEQAGAVPNFLAARPTLPELEVIAVRRGPACVEIDIDLAVGWNFAASRSRPNGAALEFAGPEVDSPP